MTPTRELDFILPGEWWSLNLRGEAATVDRRIKALVARAIGDHDARATLRFQIRQRLAEVAQNGRKVKADEVHIARTLIGPLPLAATLTISKPGFAVPASDSQEDRIQTMLTMVPGEEPTPIDHPSLAVVRSLDRYDADRNRGRGTPTLMVNYWIERPGSNQMTVFTFSTPLVELEEALLGLFDAIVFSATPRDPLPV